MKNTILIFICSFAFVQASAQNSGDEILGFWTTPDRNQVLEFVQNGDTYEAVIRQADQEEAIGKTPISGLAYSGNNRYKDGQIYVPQRDMTANCSVKVLSDDELRITVRVGVMSRKIEWTRVEFDNSSEG
ncbi:MAG: DUF2147 domain-containing protein [Bacteroidota bacterium]